MNKRFHVKLSDDQDALLKQLTSKGHAQARRLRRARTLLLAHQGHTDAQIAQALGVAVRTVERTRRRFAQEGLQAALSEKPRPGKAPKLTGKQEAVLVALACSEAPEGRQRWTMQLLADKMVELTAQESLSRETVRRTLKKTQSSPGSSTSGA